MRRCGSWAADVSIINSELYRAKKFVRLFVKHTNETLSHGTMMKSSREREKEERRPSFDPSYITD